VDPHHGGGPRPRYGAVERRSGLGLAISRHFCRLMRGDPSVESERIRTGLHLRHAAATRRWLHDTAEELVPMAAPGPDVTPGHWPLTRFDRCRRHDHGAAIVDSL
jgi:signal transduction histidine kinase